jgi:hypothetical protein
MIVTPTYPLASPLAGALEVDRFVSGTQDREDSQKEQSLVVARLPFLSRSTMSRTPDVSR